MDNATAIVLANVIEDLTNQVRSHEDAMRAMASAYQQLHESMSPANSQATETNWQRWFGTPQRTASTVSQLVDYLDALGKGEEHHTPFNDTIRVESPYALIHASTLQDWLDHAAG